MVAGHTENVIAYQDSQAAEEDTDTLVSLAFYLPG